MIKRTCRQYKDYRAYDFYTTYKSFPVGRFCIGFGNNEYILCNLSIMPDFRGKGLCKKLLADAIRVVRSRKIEKLFLTVFNNNKVAIHNYEKAGFTVVEKNELITKMVITCGGSLNK